MRNLVSQRISLKLKVSLTSKKMEITSTRLYPLKLMEYFLPISLIKLFNPIVHILNDRSRNSILSHSPRS